MVISKVVFAAFLSLSLGYAHGLESKTNGTDYSNELVTTDFYEYSTTELPSEKFTVNCEDNQLPTTLPEKEGIISIVVQDTNNSDICKHTLGLKQWVRVTSVYRLQFELKDNYDVEVMYMYDQKAHRTSIPSSGPYELHIFAGRFYLTWKRTSTSPVKLSFKYELLERKVGETKIFNEAARIVSMQDLGGFRTNTLRTFYVIGDSNKNNHSVDIVLEKLVLDDRAGDTFSIGKTSKKDSSFESTPAIMFTNSITKPVKIIVSAKDVFVSMSTVYSQGRDREGQLVDFKMSYNISGINVIKPSPTPMVTTARSPAQLQAVTMCFFELTDSEWTCQKFLDSHLKRFQDYVAELAQNYAEEEKIELPTSGGIRPEQVKVECFFQKKGKYNDSREENYITVVITHPLDEEKPLFSSQQLTEFFKANYMGRDLSRLVGYTVKSCLQYPDYWTWYFGSIGIFSACVLLLVIMWYTSYQILKRENNTNKKKADPLPWNEGAKTNMAYQDDPESGSNEYSDPHNDSNFTAHDKGTITYDGQASDSFSNQEQHRTMNSVMSNTSGFTDGNVFATNQIDRSTLLRHPKQDEALPSIPTVLKRVKATEDDPSFDDYAEIEVLSSRPEKHRTKTETSEEVTIL